jgi:hypothetical protein
VDIETGQLPGVGAHGKKSAPVARLWARLCNPASALRPYLISISVQLILINQLGRMHGRIIRLGPWKGLLALRKHTPDIAFHGDI